MIKINDSAWSAKDFILTAMLLHVASQTKFFSQAQSDALNVITNQIKLCNKEVLSIIESTPCPDLVIDTAIEDLETLLSKEENDLLFDMGLNVDLAFDEILAQLDTSSSDDA